MARERMSSVDNAWLRMDGPGNLMMIVGVLVFDGPLDHDRLRRVVSERFLSFARFTQRVDDDPAGSSWVPDREFSIERHLKRAKLPGKASDRELQALASRLAGEPLDPRHPLWTFHHVENYEGARSAIVARMHHCIADGIALVRVMLTLTDAIPDTPAEQDPPSLANPDRDRSAIDSNPWAPYLQPLTKGAVRAIEATGGLVSKSIAIVGDPDLLVDYAEVGAQLIRDAARIALMPDDSRTGLKGRAGGRKRVAWNEPLPLDEVKAISKAVGVSVNDVLLCCVAGAIRRYLVSTGEDVPAHCDVRAMVPVNLRAPSDAAQLGNRFGLVPLTLPVGIANPLARLAEVRRRMADLKGGYQALLAYALLGVLGVAPRPVQAEVLGYFSRKATAVMTNVPGPAEYRYLAGRRLSRIMFWVPQSGDVGVGVSILSYGGGVQFGVMTDTAVCANPKAIIDGFQPEFDRLLMTLAMLPPADVETYAGAVNRIESLLFGEFP